jgi:HD-GYP domain-containing protein (c-di-GMP phosphodiesterase class II)
MDPFRAHIKQGYSILKDASFPWTIADIVLQYHERLDGSGYPDGITEDGLGLEVSILAICDVVEV